MGRGAEGVHIAGIVNAFEKMGHTVILVSPPGISPLSTMGTSPLDKVEGKVSGINAIWKAVSKKAPQVLFEMLEILYNFSAIFNINKIIRNTDIDFIYERNAYFLFAGAFLSRRYKIPLIVEANEVVGIKRARKLKMISLAEFIEKFTLNTASSIFTVSSFLQEKIAGTIHNKNKIYIAPNAVDPSLYKTNTKRDEIRNQYEISNQIVLGFVGWFDWWDRLDLLIEVQGKIVEKGHHNVSTILIGDGSEADQLKSQTKSLDLEDKIIFTGAVGRQDVIDYIDAIDIGVLPHSNEFGSPVVLFEMMALGKLVVAPSLKPITDVITHNKNGLLFPPLNKKMLLKRILAAIEDPVLKNSITEDARKTVFKEHTWNNNAKRILNSITTDKSNNCLSCGSNGRKLAACSSKHF